MNANDLSLFVGVVVGCIGVYLAVVSARRDANLLPSHRQMLEKRIEELEATLRTLQRELNESEKRMSMLETANLEQASIIERQAGSIASMEAELQLYRAHWAQMVARTRDGRVGPRESTKRWTTRQLKLLRDVLVGVYDEPSRAREIALRAGVKADTLPIDKPDMATWWDATLYAANNQGKVMALVEAALNDATVFAAHADLLDWLNQSAS